MSSAVELFVNRSTSIAYKKKTKIYQESANVDCQNVRDSFSTRFMTFSLDPKRTAPYKIVSQNIHAADDFMGM